MDDPNTDATPIACVILAAGASARLGQPKQLVTLNGCTLIENAINAALKTEQLWPVIVVLGANAIETRKAIVRYPVLVVENAAWEEGVASSLRSGLEVAQSYSRDVRSVLFAVCDQPSLSSDIFCSILKLAERRDRLAVAARYDNHPGTPALIQRALFGELAHLTGDEGARKIFQRLAPTDLELIDFPELAFDVDTVEDLAAAQERARSSTH